jgi:YD repeat-containing protein
VNTKHSKTLLLFVGFLAFWAVSTFSVFNKVYAEEGALPPSVRPLAPDMHKQFKTDLLTGSASFNLPIVLPPGRKEVQPNISLVYSSANSNGWCGVGWDLNLGSIQRSTKGGNPKYDETDAFLSSFNGLTSELVQISPLEYRAKLESQFLRFFYNIAKHYWEVTDKDGAKYFFGSDENARISNGEGIFKWCLDKVRDVHGNYMSISYIKDRGQIYPRQIVYTGNEHTGEPPKCSVDFVLQDRKDAPPNYRAGPLTPANMKMQTAKRLCQIDVKVNAVRTRKYMLEYIYSSETNRSLLNSLTQYGADGVSSLPPITFDYQTGGGIAPPSEIPQIGSGDNIWNIKWSTGNDFPTGDKILYPLLRWDWSFKDGTRVNKWSKLHREASGVITGNSWSSDTQNGNFQCQAAEGSAFYISTYLYAAEPTTLTLSLSKETNPACFLNEKYISSSYQAEHIEPRYNPELSLQKGFNFIEITGYSQSGGSMTGETFMLSGAPADIVKVMSSKKVMFSSPVGDFNGDGRTDIGSYDNLTGRWEVALSQGGDFAPSEEWWVDTNISSYGMPVGGDFNGDGYTDVGIYRSYADIVFSNGSGFDYGFNFRGFNRETPFTGDFNGDGLTDMGETLSGSFCWGIYFCDGSSFSIGRDWNTFFTGPSGTPVVGDFNGDGLADLCGFHYFDGEWFVALSPIISKGWDEYDRSGSWLTDFGKRKTPLAADFNNDGLTDVGFFDKDLGRWEIALSDGTKFVPAGIWLDNFGKGAVWAPQCGDFNGDGLLDAGIFNTTSVEGGKRAIAYARGTVPDLLSCVSNGLGGSLSVTYKPSTQFENTFLPFPLQVVDSVTRDDGLGHRYTTTYSYADGFYDVGDREFRGFGYVKTNDPEQNITETWFHQEDIYKGKIYKQTIRDSFGNPYQEVLKTWEKSNPYSGHSEINFPYLASEDLYTYGEDNISKQTRTCYEYDNYGNITAAVNYGEAEGSVDVRGDRRSTYSEYTYNETDWILNKPFHIYTEDCMGNKLSEKWFCYDNQDSYTDSPIKGNLTKKEVWCYNFLTTLESLFATHYAYDEYGNCTSTIDALGNETITSYEKVYHTYPENITNALGHIQEFTYDAVTGQILTSTDSNNNTTRNEYDEFGRLSRVFGPDDDSDYPRIWYEYDMESFPTKVITYTREEKNADKVLTSYTFYDGLSRVIQNKSEAEDAAKSVVKDTVLYNSKGQIKKKWLPYFAARSSDYSPPDDANPNSICEYDPLGRVTLNINADGTSNYTSYSAWVRDVTDENGQRKRFTQDAYGNLIKVEEFNDTEIYITTYIYDILDNLIFISDSQGNITTITYDTLSQKIAMKDVDMGNWSYDYDANGNLIKQTDAKGQVVGFEYDELNRVKKKWGEASGETVPISSSNYYYNDDLRALFPSEIEDLQTQQKIGRLDKIVYPSGQTEFLYDNMGREVRTIKTIDGIAFTVQHAYDLLNRVTSIIYPDGEKVNYIYNQQGQVEKVEGEAVYVSGIDYNASGQMINIEYGNGTHTDYSPETLRLTNLKTNDGVIQDLLYQFDKVGNITAITDSVTATSQTLQYDSLNRLTAATGNYGTKTYQYDSIGNMLQKGEVTLTYGENGAGPHAVTSLEGGETISYDANGNMLSKDGAVYRYDNENRLIEVTSSAQPDVVNLDIELQPEWNFISLPVIPDSWSLDVILSSLEYQFDYDQAARYNPEDSSFEYYCHNLDFNQFDTMQYGRGYQLYVTNPSGCKLTISGRPPANSGIALASGWNLIGAPTISQITVEEALADLTRNTDYDRIVRYNPGTKTFSELSDSDNLKAGESYFIHMSYRIYRYYFRIR